MSCSKISKLVRGSALQYTDAPEQLHLLVKQNPFFLLQIPENNLWCLLKFKMTIHPIVPYACLFFFFFSSLLGHRDTTVQPNREHSPPETWYKGPSSYLRTCCGHEPHHFMACDLATFMLPWHRLKHQRRGSLRCKHASSIRLSHRQACRASSGLLMDGGEQPIVGGASPELMVLSSTGWASQ